MAEGGAPLRVTRFPMGVLGWILGSRLKVVGKFSLEPRASSLERSGFTFVELLIAATMMSILFVGLGAYLRGGLTVWHRVTTTVEAVQHERVALDRLERDLANALIYDERSEPYGTDLGLLPWPQFESNALACYTVTPVTPPQPPVIRFVTYACKEIDGTAGLWRTSQAVGAARARLTVTPELVLPDCEQLAFRYASWSSSQPSSEPQPIDWKIQWSEAQRQLPRLVEVSVTRSSGNPVKRVFAIPVGQGSPAGP